MRVSLFVSHLSIELWLKLAKAENSQEIKLNLKLNNNKLQVIIVFSYLYIVNTIETRIYIKKTFFSSFE